MREKRKDMNKACDEWLASRGWPKFSFQGAYESQLSRALLRKRREAQALERAAREIEDGGA